MTLRQRLARPEILLCPGIYDAFSASLAEAAGFEGVYLSGASIAYTRLGRPDIGLVSQTEVADVLFRIRERVELPIVVDADTGFGNALNVERTMRLFERSGADAIQLEDQTFPKRCGHLQEKRVIPAAEMVGKIRAAVDARRNRETLVIARTDAIAVEGFEPALERAGRYVEAGADMLFVEAPQTLDQMRAIVARLGSEAPLMANMVEGGKTPLRSAGDLQDLGFSLVIFPGGLVRALAPTMQAYFASLKEHGTTAPFRDRMHDFLELNALLGTDEILARGKRYEEEEGK
jgi:2-methylisocitrate lyase-like PEP mutase family enzyme